MRQSFLTGLLAAPLSAYAVALTGYEYIVVGSGAGGGPLAARLAMECLGVTQDVPCFGGALDSSTRIGYLMAIAC